MATSYFATDPTALRLSVSAVVRREPESAEILLMRRSDNGLWGLPGGYVELGESVAQAAAREVQEETGFEIEVGRLIGVYSDPSRQVVAAAHRNAVVAGAFLPVHRPIGINHHAVQRVEKSADVGIAIGVANADLGTKHA